MGKLFLSLILFIFGLSNAVTILKPIKKNHLLQLEHQNEVTIAIIATNDIHGTAFPTQMIRADTKEKYTYGGLVYMASMMETIRKQYGKINTVWLDGGDQFQGGIQSSQLVSNGKIMNQFFNTLGLNGAAIGNHQFDYGPQFLDSYLKRNDQSFLSANLFSEKDQDVKTFLSNSKRSKIIQLQNGVKLGMIGLTALDTPQTSAGFTNKLFEDIKIKDYVDIVNKQSKLLRQKGAQIIILVSHEGNVCPGQSLNLGIWKNTTQQISCPDGPITNLLDELPTGTIDAVVQGHRHRTIHFYKNNIPIVGSIKGGYYFNIIYVTFNKKANKIVDTIIEGPIPVCQKIFSNTGRCDYIPQQNINGVGDLINWKFHNTTVIAHQELKTQYDKWQDKMTPYLEQLAINNVYLYPDQNNQCGLFNLGADLLLKTQKEADFSLVNPGGFRTPWRPGIIQYQHFYGMFPFSNYIQTFEITGKQLKQMFKILQQGQYGYYTASGLRMKVSKQNHSLLQIHEQNGDQIIDDKTYIGVTLDFLLKGGDDMKDVICETYTPRNVKTLGDFKTLVKPFLMELGTITKQTAINNSKPKLIVV